MGWNGQIYILRWVKTSVFTRVIRLLTHSQSPMDTWNASSETVHLAAPPAPPCARCWPSPVGVATWSNDLEIPSTGVCENNPCQSDPCGLVDYDLIPYHHHHHHHDHDNDHVYIYICGGFLKWGYPQFSSSLVRWIFLVNHPALGVPRHARRRDSQAPGANITGWIPEMPWRNWASPKGIIGISFRKPMIFCWLVVYLPLWKIWVTWDDCSQDMESHKIHVPNHQPVWDLTWGSPEKTYGFRGFYGGNWVHQQERQIWRIEGLLWDVLRCFNLSPPKMIKWPSDKHGVNREHRAWQYDY